LGGPKTLAPPPGAPGPRAPGAPQAPERRPMREGAPKKLQVSENSWAAQQKARKATQESDDEGSSETGRRLPSQGAHRLTRCMLEMSRFCLQARSRSRTS